MELATGAIVTAALDLGAGVLMDDRADPCAWFAERLPDGVWFDAICIEVGSAGMRMA
jgi:hypothetical protein